jgi:hypothetical protein
METFIEVELLLDASPLMALPPLVLPETVALPLLAVWLLVLLTFTLLLFVTLKLLLLVEVMRLVEFGPVLLMLALPPPKPLLLAIDTAGVELLTETDSFVELLL